MRSKTLKYISKTILFLSLLFILFPSKVNAAGVSRLKTGSLVNTALTGVCSDMTEIKWATEAFTSDVDISASGEPVYARANGTVIELYTDADTVYTNADSSGMFVSSTVQYIRFFGDKVDTSETTNMHEMFNGCTALLEIDNLDSIDTSNVIYIGGVFQNCKSLSSVNISGWNVSNARSLEKMFSGCNNITSVGDLSSWITNNATSTEYMFNGCNKLQSIDLSGWNTSNVATMRDMFNNCQKLTSVGDISGWDVSSCANFKEMFNVCLKLENVDTSGWTSTVVTSMDKMFGSCSKLSVIDISGLQVKPGTTISSAIGSNTPILGCNKGLIVFKTPVLYDSASDYEMALPANMALDDEEDGWTEEDGNWDPTINTATITSGSSHRYVRLWTVTFNVEDNTSCFAKQYYDATQSRTAHLPTGTAPDKAGYVFDNSKWYTNAACTSVYNFNNTITADKTLYGAYKVATYTITYDANGGTGTVADQTKTHGTPISLRSNLFEKTGYHFAGWNTEATGLSGTAYDEGDPYTTDADVILYARWAPNTDTLYTVKHYKQKLGKPAEISAENYELANTDTETGTSDASASPSLRTYTGFTAPASQTITVNADGSSIAKYYYTRNSYALTLSKGTGIDTVSGAGTYEYGSTVTMTATPLAGYTFQKWDDAGTITNASYTFDMPANALSYTAIATANSDTPYTVKHYKQKLDGTYDDTPDDTDPGSGITGAQVTPGVKTYTGFTSPETQTMIIVGDGSLVVEYHYTRNSYTLDLACGTGVSSVTGNGTYLYGEAVTIDAVVAPGYTWDTWSGDITETTKDHTFAMPANALSLTASATANDNTAYTVRHFKQNLDGTYNVTPDDTDTGTGTTNTSVTPGTKTYTGFTAPSTSTGTITGDGSLVIDYLYTRNSYEVALTSGTGIGSVSGAGTYLYGASVTIDAAVLPGYSWEAWTGDIAETTKQHTFAMPAGNVTARATTTANDDTEYTVKHYKQNIDGSYNDEPDETETKSGTTDDDATPDVKTYAGFTSPVAQTDIIAGNGSTVFEYYYTRNSYELDLLSGTGIDTVTGSDTYKYGQSVTIDAAVTEGYTWNKWDGSITETTKAYTFTMPADDMTLTAYATANTDTQYTVNHYKQNIDGTYNAIPDISEPGAGTTDTQVTPAAKSFEGFTAPETQTDTIAGDGSLSFDYYYTRNSYDLELAAGTGISSVQGAGTYKYGKTVDIDATVMPGYTWSGWTGDLTVTDKGYSFQMPAGDTSLTANATADEDTTYKVNHYKQKLDGTYNVIPDEVENRTGTTNTDVTPSTNTYEGFTAPVTQTKTITGDDQMKIDYFYTRNSYSLVLNKGVGISSVTANDVFLYGESVNIDATLLPGYSWTSWTGDFTENTKAYTFTMPASDVALTANGTPDTNTAYVVKHYKQNIDGTYNDEPDETENKTGTTDTQVTPGTKTYEGFTSPETASVQVNGSGTTVVEYRYVRNTYELTLNSGTGIDSTTGSGTYKYEQSISIEAAVKPGYTWEKWDGDIETTTRAYGFTMPAGNITMTAHAYADNSTPYKVKHYKQNIDGSYNSEPDETDNNEDITDMNVTPAVKDYAGFTAPETQTVQVNGNGSTVVTYLYTRNSYDLTLLVGAGIGSVTGAGTYKYDEEISIDASLLAGYTFAAWTGDLTKNEKSTTIHMPAGNATLTATATANNDTAYVVKHYKQNIDGTYNTEPDDTDNGTGTTNLFVTPEVKEYEGFTSPDTQRVKINGNGSTVITYQYERNSYELTLNAGEGVSSVSGAGTWKYGQNVDINATLSPGYVWDKWDGDLTKDTQTASVTMPAGDITLTAYAVADTSTGYVVKHYKQNIDESYNDEPDETQNLTGTTGVDVTPSAKYYDGFITPATQTVTINGNGSTVVEYRYVRRSYTVTLNKGLGIDSVSGSGTYKFEENVNINATVAQGYVWAGWTGDAPQTDKNSIFAMPAENIELTATVTPGEDTVYTVKHYKQNLDGTYNNEPDDIDHKTAATGTHVAPAVKEYEGFTAPSAETVQISGDGSTEVTYLYTRNVYTLTLYVDPHTGTSNPTGSGTYLYEQEVTIDVDIEQGYTWKEWQGTITSTTKNYTFTMPAEDVSLDAIATPNDDTGYTVNHYLQKADGTYGNMPDYIDHETGTTGTYVSGTEKSIDGYSRDEWNGLISDRISGDGSTTLDIRYKRDQYILSLIADEGIESVSGAGTYRWGETVTINAVTKDQYKWTKWEDDQNGSCFSTTKEYTFEMPMRETMLVAHTNSYQNVGYTVRHYYQKVTSPVADMDPANYDLVEVPDEAMEESSITPELRPETGFTPQQEAAQVTVSERGDTVVEYFYSRNRYTVNLTAGEGIESVTGADSYLYGQSVLVSATPIAGYEFSTWTGTSTSNTRDYTFTMPAEDVYLTATGTVRADITYTVNHYIQKLGSDPLLHDEFNYDLYDYEPLTGKAGDVVTPEVETIPGFISPEVQSLTIDANGLSSMDYYYVRKTDCPYRVEYYLQNTDDPEYTLQYADTITDTGTYEELITPPVKYYDGYISPEQVSVKIGVDMLIGDTTVVKYHYAKIESNEHNIHLVDVDEDDTSNILGVHSYYMPEGTLVSVDDLITSSYTDNDPYVQYKYSHASAPMTVIDDGTITMYRYYQKIYTSATGTVDTSETPYGYILKTAKLELMRNGTVFKTKTLYVDSKSEYSYTFTNLLAYDEYGVPYTYYVRCSYKYEKEIEEDPYIPEPETPVDDYTIYIPPVITDTTPAQPQIETPVVVNDPEPYMDTEEEKPIIENDDEDNNEEKKIPTIKNDPGIKLPYISGKHEEKDIENKDDDKKDKEPVISESDREIKSERQEEPPAEEDDRYLMLKKAKKAFPWLIVLIILTAIYTAGKIKVYEHNRYNL